MAELGLIKSLAGVLAKIAGGGRAEVKSLKILTERKFSEIEKTHAMFIKLLTKLNQSARSCQDKLDTSRTIPGALSQFRRALEPMVQERQKLMHKRREQYEEARAYARFGFEEKGLLKRVPDDVSTQLASLSTIFSFSSLSMSCLI
jgi:hypothetical protein